MFQTYQITLTFIQDKRIYFDVEHIGEQQEAVELDYCECKEFYPKPVRAGLQGIYLVYFLSSSTVDYFESGEIKGLQSIIELSERLSQHLSANENRVFHSVLQAVREESTSNGFEGYRCPNIP